MITSEDEIAVCEGIDSLPDEILIKIFKKLPLDSLLNCENVCKRWKHLARDSSIWRHILIVYSGKPGQSEVSQRNLQIIMTHHKYIQRLKLQYVYSYPFIRELLDKCDNLTSIEIIMCRIGHFFESEIKKFRNLKHLNLKNTLLQDFDYNIMIDYGQFKELQFLSLCEFGLSLENCDTLFNCPNLSHILIEKVKCLTGKYITKLIESKQNILQTLHIYGDDTINDDTMKLLSQCPHLKDLAIIRCDELTDESLAYLEHFKNLEHLQLWFNKVFTESMLIKAFGAKNLTKLKSLSFSRIKNLSPPIIDIISEYYMNLKFLSIYQCPKLVDTDYEKQLKPKLRNIEVVLY